MCFFPVKKPIKPFKEADIEPKIEHLIKLKAEPNVLKYYFSTLTIFRKKFVIFSFAHFSFNESNFETIGCFNFKTKIIA